MTNKTQDPPFFIDGIQIFVVHEEPKMQLSIDCPVTPAMREETNAWLRDFFGTKSVIPDGCIFLDPKTQRHYCSAATMDVLKRGVAIQKDAKLPQTSADKRSKPPTSSATPRGTAKRHSKHRKQMPRR